MSAFLYARMYVCVTWFIWLFCVAVAVFTRDLSDCILSAESASGRGRVSHVCVCVNFVCAYECELHRMNVYVCTDMRMYVKCMYYLC